MISKYHIPNLDQMVKQLEVELKGGIDTDSDIILGYILVLTKLVRDQAKHLQEHKK